MENKTASATPAIEVRGVESINPYSYWRLPSMIRFMGLGKTTIYDLMRSDPTFPRPVKIGSATAWRSDEVIAWMDNRPRVEFMESAA